MSTSGTFQFIGTYRGTRTSIVLADKLDGFNGIDPAKGLISTDSSFASSSYCLYAAGNRHRNQGLRVVYQRSSAHYKHLRVGEARILAPFAHFPPRKELNGLITDFLKDTEAVIPKLNPNFGKAAPKAPAKKKALAPDDLPGDWKNRAGKASVIEGALHIESKGANSFIGVGAGITTGKAKLSFRIRAPQAGEGKVTLLGAAGGAEVLSVPYQTSGEAVWQTISVDLEPKQATGILRLYLPTGSAAVELDDIVLTPAQGAPRRWDF